MITAKIVVEVAVRDVFLKNATVGFTYQHFQISDSILGFAPSNACWGGVLLFIMLNKDSSGQIFHYSFHKMGHRGQV